MRTRIKICGVCDAPTLAVCAAAGVDAVGFVLAPSPRRLSLENARSLARGTPAPMVRVAVTRAVDPAQLASNQATDAFDWRQSDIADRDVFLHHRLLGRFLPVCRIGPDLENELDLAGGCAAAVIEGSVSGAGVQSDWTRIAQAIGPRRGDIRIILAGGLDPENVGEAIRLLRPFAVDVSSGVESAPGVKDPARIRAFVQAVREADRSIDGVIS